ncbi:hypothetical protein D3C86_1695300 [compost metagenome]
MTQDGLLIFAPAIVDKLSSSVPVDDASSPVACRHAAGHLWYGSKRLIVLDIISVFALSLTRLDLCLGGQGAVLQAVGLVARLDDVAGVCQPI